MRDQILLWVRRTVFLTVSILSLANTKINSQDLNSAVQFIQQFTSTNQQLPRERVYLQTDRDWYYSGDRIWFSAYVVFGGYNFLSNISNVLYVELVRPNGEVINRELIKLTEGRGSGSITFGENDADAGIYQIRAYTRWATNFGDSYTFTRNITVYNEDNWQPEILQTSEFDVQFFPEGGHLVAGLPTTLAFKAISTNGCGKNIEGTIVDGEGNLVTGIRSEHLGMGAMEFTPKKGASYHGIVDGQQFDLPEVRPEGVVMNIHQTNDHYLVKLQSTENSPEISFILFAHVRGLVYYASEVMSTPEGFAAVIPKADIASGIVHFTLLDDKASPIAERLAYNKNPKDQLKITLTPDNDEYLPRNEVVTDVQITDPEGKPLNATASISVFDDSIHPYHTYNSDICSHLTLETEIRGHIEQAGFYFSDHEKADEYLDLLMLTQGWRAYNMENPVTQEDIQSFYPSEQGLTVSGTIKTLLRQRPIENAVAYISVGSEEDAYILTTDEDGRFSISDLSFTGEKMISVKGNDAKGSDRLQVLLDEQFEHLSDSYSPILQSIPGSLEPFVRTEQVPHETLTDRSETNQETTEEFANYQMSGELEEITVTGNEESTDWVSSYFNNLSGAGSNINLDDEKYKHLQNHDIEQILHQLSGVRYDQLSRRISIREGRSDPLIYVDGMEVAIETLLNISTVNIQSIVVVRSAVDLAMFGSDGAGGALIIETRSGGGIQGRVRGLSGDIFQGFQAPAQFYSPKYGIAVPKDLDVEDSRITLYWDPEANINDQTGRFRFWTNDVPSTYRIVLQGLTETGLPFKKTTTFSIRNEMP